MFKKLLSIVFVLFFSKAVFGAHPLITDDTGTQGAGKFQIEINGEYGHEDENEVTENSMELSVIMSYGITDSLDFVIGVPYQYVRTEDSEETIDEGGISDTSIEIKWRFYEKDWMSLALKPAIALPAGDESKGLGNGRASYGLVLIATADAEPLTIHFNAGYTHNEYRLDSDEEANKKGVWHASLASEIEAGKNLTAVANIGIERNSDKESSTNPAFILGGLIYSLSENLDIDAGIKAGLNKPETDYSILAGMAVRF